MSTGDFLPWSNTGHINLTTGAGLTISNGWNPIEMQLELNLPKDPNFQGLCNRIAELEKRLLVLHPNGELHEKYPALKEAYDTYLIIEKLVNGKQE
jgi:hypothetical protein